MAERSVRTGDEEDQARAWVALEQRVAALEREHVEIPPAEEPTEPCCCPVGAVEAYSQDRSAVVAEGSAYYPWDGTTRSCGASLDCGSLAIIFETEALWHVTASVPFACDGSPMVVSLSIELNGGSYSIANDAQAVSTTDQLYMHASRDWHFFAGDRIALRVAGHGGAATFLAGGYLSAHLVDCSCVEDVEWEQGCTGLIIVTPPICPEVG